MDGGLMFAIGKNLTLFLAKISPIIGGFVIVASLESDGSGGPWTEIWRISMSVALGVFVALVGMIYKNINDRLENMEKRQELYVTLREYDARHADMKTQLDRIERLMASGVKK